MLGKSSHRPEPCALIVFGGAGDLAKRKLIPAIFNLATDGLLPQSFYVVGAARRDWDNTTYRNTLREGVDKFSRQKPKNEADWEKVGNHIYYAKGDLDNDEGYKQLAAQLATLDEQYKTGGRRLFYLATPPGYFGIVIGHLKRNNLLLPPEEGNPWTGVILEKPIGRDLKSAKSLLQEVGRHTSENQVFRIDHYLGKETVQNLLALRFGNSIFEPVWNNKYVHHVQISVAESVGVGSRGGYYDKAGALRDMVQNHLFQLLCLVAMEPPGRLNADLVRNEKVQVLRSLRCMKPEEVFENVVRAQYTAANDGSTPGYRKEEKVSPDSSTETFTAMRLCIDNWRWAGVPFLLRTGKHLKRRETEISVHFKVPPLLYFDHVQDTGPIGNILTINVQPDEGGCLRLAAKIPGAGLRLKNILMDFNYEETFQTQTPEAYERLLLEALHGDQTLFTRADEVEAAWDFLDPILKAWENNPQKEMAEYKPGSWGPEEMNRLLPSGVNKWFSSKDESEDVVCHYAPREGKH